MGFRSVSLRPVDIAVLLHNVYHCPDASNDADHTVNEIVTILNKGAGYLSKDILESALYCCNMNNEQGKFWHPQKISFDSFVKHLLGAKFTYDTYYNLIEAKNE
jgi:hypothetical protein